MIAYLDAVLAENDPQLMIAALYDIARAQGKSAVAAAGLLIEGHRDGTPAGKRPEFGAVLKVIDALGLRLHVTFAPAPDRRPCPLAWRYRVWRWMEVSQ